MNKYLLLFLLAFGLTSVAHSQIPQNSINIQDVNLTCIDKSGVPVPTRFDVSAKAYSGGYAKIDADGSTLLTFDEASMNAFTKLAALFVFYHECGHIALPIGVGYESIAREVNADCYAIKEMRKQGLLTSWTDFSEAMAPWAKTPGDSEGHLPGPQRLAAAATCARVPQIYSNNSLCRHLDEILLSAPGHLDRFEGNTAVPGLYCKSMDEGIRLHCRRGIESKQERVSTAETLVSTVESCLPSSFKKRRSTFLGEFGVSFESDEFDQVVSILSDPGLDMVQFGVRLQK